MPEDDDEGETGEDEEWGLEKGIVECVVVAILSFRLFSVSIRMYFPRILYTRHMFASHEPQLLPYCSRAEVRVSFYPTFISLTYLLYTHVQRFQ